MLMIYITQYIYVIYSIRVMCYSIWNFDLAFRPLGKPAPPSRFLPLPLGEVAFPTPCKR